MALVFVLCIAGGCLSNIEFSLVQIHRRTFIKESSLYYRYKLPIILELRRIRVNIDASNNTIRN